MENLDPLYQTISVQDKLTGEIIKIKDFRFNPEIHEKIESAQIIKSSSNIREQARQLGIKSWHVKNIENLKQEILNLKENAPQERF